MSSILRALKKIEKIAPRQEDSPPWPRPINKKKAVNSRVKKTWLYNKLLSIGAALIVMLLIGWLGISHRHMIIAKLFPAKPASVSQQQSISSKQKEHVNDTKIKKTAPNSDGAPQRRSSPAGKPSIQKKSMKMSSQRSLPGQRSSNESSPLKGSTNFSASKKISPLRHAKISNQPNQPPGLTASPKVPVEQANSSKSLAQKRKKSAAPNRQSALPRITDSQLFLQAIAWSNDSSQRLAVINNRIVREGESVDGYSITEIRQEDVVLNDGTNAWRLEFSLRQ